MHAHDIEYLLGGRGGGAVAPLEDQPGVTYVEEPDGAAAPTPPGPAPARCTG